MTDVCNKLGSLMTTKRTVLYLLASLFGVLRPVSAETPILPVISHYDLNIQFRLSEQRINVVAVLTVKNVSSVVQSRLPFLLYRLLTVEQVNDVNGSPFSYAQNVVQLRDEPTLQATALTVDLPTPLLPNDSLTIAVRYGGFIYGYPEVMAYVRDRVDETYSLLRPDAFAYPLLTDPSIAGVIAAYQTKFTYTVRATVPKSYRAACGGELTNILFRADSSTFTFRSKIPTWRIDVAVAMFAVLKSSHDDLMIYHLPQDSAGARRVLREAQRVIKFYTDAFGKPSDYRGYTIIEIPDAWGSQASDYYFLQSAAAFVDSSSIPEVYHEIGHTWNVAASPEIQRCRYFDEAFASFFAALAIREFQGENAFKREMGRSRNRFVRAGRRDSLTIDTPIVEYGEKELGQNSYTKGAWSLWVLYRIVGEKTFESIIRKMMTEYARSAINFEEFQLLCERVSGKKLDKFFREWIYGTVSSRLMLRNSPIEEIAARY
jgi:hypothetical protein